MVFVHVSHALLKLFHSFHIFFWWFFFEFFFHFLGVIFHPCNHLSCGDTLMCVSVVCSNGSCEDFSGDISHLFVLPFLHFTLDFGHFSIKSDCSFGKLSQFSEATFNFALCEKTIMVAVTVLEEHFSCHYGLLFICITSSISSGIIFITTVFIIRCWIISCCTAGCSCAC